MWQLEREPAQDGSWQKLTVSQRGCSLTGREVYRLWQDNAGFRVFFNRALAETPYPAFFWELPPATSGTQDKAFECILADSPQLARMAPEPAAFAERFRSALPDGLVAVFPNLGGDAVLVAPCPNSEAGPYPHLAAFCRRAPALQLQAFWQAVGKSLLARLGTAPLWLSTSGLGVAWLHARLERRPKYYTHAPYRRWPAGNSGAG